jgi:hypothetical protein
MTILKPIDHFEDNPNCRIYGYGATIDNRRSEIVRAYAGAWHVFTYAYGILNETGDVGCLTFNEARTVALAYLKGTV